MEEVGGTVVIVTSRAGEPVSRDTIPAIKQSSVFAFHRAAVCTKGKFAFFEGDLISITHKPSGYLVGSFPLDRAESLYAILNERHNSNGLWGNVEVPKVEMEWAKPFVTEPSR